jgi:hypothetical protein
MSAGLTLTLPENLADALLSCITDRLENLFPEQEKSPEAKSMIKDALSLLDNIFSQEYFQGLLRYDWAHGKEEELKSKLFEAIKSLLELLSANISHTEDYPPAVQAFADKFVQMLEDKYT